MVLDSFEEEFAEEGGAPEFDESNLQKLRESRNLANRYDVISQYEIDSLLFSYKQVNPSAETQQPDRRRAVRVYDFSSPDKFSKEHIRNLNALHTSFVENLALELSELFHLPVTVNLVDLEQMTFKEYMGSIPSPTLLAEVSAQPLTPNILFEINPSLVGAWVDAFCGGDPNHASSSSNLTAIDLAVSDRAIDVCVKAYADAWMTTVAFNPTINKIIVSDDYVQQLLPTDAVLVCTADVSSGQYYGMITVCVPAIDIETVFRVQAESRVASSQNRRVETAAQIAVEKALDPVRLECRVVMGDTPISVNDVLNLRVGDVIKTACRADDDLSLMIGNDKMFACRPGTVGRNMGVVISHVLDNAALTSLKDRIG